MPFFLLHKLQQQTLIDTPVEPRLHQRSNLPADQVIRIKRELDLLPGDALDGGTSRVLKRMGAH